MTRKFIHPAVATGAAVAVTVMMTAAAAGATPRTSTGPHTATPIKHVVVIIGENHSFDNVFATYQPPGHQKIWNLLSEGIVTKSGAPGPNFKQARQLTASNTKTYSLNPKITGAYKTLPAPNTTYVSPACDGQNLGVPDTRFPALPSGPYQITKSVPYFDDHIAYSSNGQCEFYGAYVGDPLHRFYQMWQQYGHHGQLNTWVANTAGDDNGAQPPAAIFQGAVQMGFYNMARGDAPILSDLARHYAISDNYHQAVMGGTGANHIALGTGFAASYQNSSGQAVPPPPGRSRTRTPSRAPTTTTPRTATAAAPSPTSAAATPSAPTRKHPGSARSTGTWRPCPTRRSGTASAGVTTC